MLPLFSSSTRYIAIRWTLILPFWFMFLTFCWFMLANMPATRSAGEHSCWRTKHVYWERHCLPLQMWFLNEGYLQRFLKNFQLDPEELPGRKAAKVVVLLLAFFIVGGSLVWIIGAYVMSLMGLRVFLFVLRIVKVSRSAYYPGHEHDEIRRHAITQVGGVLEIEMFSSRRRPRPAECRGVGAGARWDHVRGMNLK